MTPLAQTWAAIGGSPESLVRCASVADPSGALPSSFAVESLGHASFACLGMAVAELAIARETSAHVGAVSVDAAMTCDALRSEQALRIDGEPPGTIWDPLSRTFRAADGWVRLHGNYEHHRQAIERALGTTVPEALSQRIAALPAVEVERLVLSTGGAAGAARTRAQWLMPRSGGAVAPQPLIATTLRPDHAPLPDRPAKRPLEGLRVLAMTRVIAGPVAGRALAWFGADVLRIEAPGARESTVLTIDTGPGKRSTRLNLAAEAGRVAFEALLEGADVLLHGLRPGALDALGYDAARRAALSPGLIDASLCAYGSGPLLGARGFDSIVQLVTGLGLAEAEAAGNMADGPRALPCQALDHCTGILLAAATIRALAARAGDGRGRAVTASLSRTADHLAGLGRQERHDGMPPPPRPGRIVLHGAFGETLHVGIPVAVAGVPGGWTRAPARPGADAPRWIDALSAIH